MSTESLEAIDLPLPYETRQPRANSTVWQANQLAIARYQATPMEQKLILYAIAMIDAKATDFARYRIHVAAYADACGIEPNNVYRRLREAADALALSPLLIEGHVADDGKIVDLLTHWFSEVEYGDGYIDVTFPRGLKKYLIEVRNLHFKFDLGIPLQFSGDHAIRLYQWCKRWKFIGHSKSVTLTELRHVLGLTVFDKKGKIIKERLPAYGDMKKWALLPALAEINRASDISVSMKEVKEPGIKRVASILLSIRDNPNYTPNASVPRLPGIRKAAPVNPTVANLLATLQTEFCLSALQARRAVTTHSVEYIEAQAAIVRSKPRKNAAAHMILALKEGWTREGKIKPVAPVKKAAPAPDPLSFKPPEPPDPEALERFARDMARYKASKKGPKVIEHQTALNLGQTDEATSSTPPPVLDVAGMSGK